MKAFFKSASYWVRSGRIRPGDVSLALFIAAGIAGLAQLSAPVPFGDGFEMVAIARNIAEHGSFGNPSYIAKTGPTAANPPLYPLLLAAFFWVLKPGGVFFVATVGNILANATVAALLPRVSAVFYGQRAPGILASIFWIASARLMPSWDVSYAVLCLVSLCLLAGESPGPLSLRSGVSVGILAGCTALLNPSTMLIAMPWILYIAVRRVRVFPRQIGYFCVVSAVMALTLAPWIIRNRVVFGAYVFRTNLGMTLNASLSDCSQATLMGTIKNGCYAAYHPNMSLREASQLKAMGEVKYDQERVHDAQGWVARNPRRFAELTVQRFVYFWLPPDAGTPVQEWALWLATAVSIPGLFLMIGRRESVTAFVVPTLVLYPTMYYLVVSDVRYRYPVLWISFLAAGYAICRALPRLKRMLEARLSSQVAAPPGLTAAVEEK